MHRIKNIIIDILLVLSMAVPVNVVYAENIYGEDCVYTLSGKCNYKQGKVMLLAVKKTAQEPYKGSDIGFIDIADIKADGSYCIQFYFNKKPADYKIITRVGNDETTEGIISINSSLNISVNNVQQNGTIEVEINTINCFSNFVRFSQFAVVYNSDGRMIKIVDLKQKTIDGNDSKTSKYYISVPSDSANIKIITLNDLKRIRPYSSAVSMEVKQKDCYEIYVSPKGSDAADGSFDNPLASFDGAVKKVRGMPKDKPINVYFRGGAYKINSSINLDSRDSGTSETPVTYMAYANETPEFIGGVYINGDEFIKASDERVKNDNVYCFDLKAAGLSDYMGEVKPSGQGSAYNANGMELFVDDKAYEFARWPNRDEKDFNAYKNIKSVIDSGNENGGNLPRFTVDNDVIDRMNSWSDYKDIILKGYVGLPYYDFGFNIRTIENNVITLNNTCNGGIKKNGVFYFYNILEELDNEGEFYIDRENAKLYVYSENGSLSGKKIMLTTFDTGDLQRGMLNITGTSNINLYGLTFNGSMGCGVAIPKGEDINISGCTIKNVSVRGIYASKFFSVYSNAYGKLSDYDYVPQVKNLKIVECRIVNTGHGSISLYGGDRRTLESAGFEVFGCELENFGRIINAYAPALDLRGAGIEIRNNKIHRGDSMGIQMYGNDILIENNEIYDVVREATDCGAIYTGGCAESGVVVKNNYFHDLDFNHGSSYFMAYNQYAKVPFKLGVYNDNAGSLLTVESNVFRNIPAGYMSVGFGNKVNNNIFIDVMYPLYERYNNILRDKLYNSETGELNENIEFTYEMADNAMVELGIIDENNSLYSAWKEKYPEVFEWQKYIKSRGAKAIYPKCNMSDNLITFIQYCDYAMKITDIFSDKLVHEISDLEKGESIVENNIFELNIPFTDIEHEDFSIQFGSSILGILQGLRKITTK